MRRETTMLCTALLASAALASADGQGPLQHALSLTSEHGSDAVLLLDEKRIAVAEDGRVTTRIRQVQRLLTDHALDAYGDPIVTFDSEHQEVHVKRARCLRADGATVDIKDNAINVLTPRNVARAPFYADLQETAITFLGLEKGAATELVVEIEDEEPYRDVLWGTEPLWDTRDIVRRTIEIRVPAGRDIVWFTSGPELDPEVKETSAGRTYRFEVTDREGIDPDAVHGAARDRLPTLYWVEDVGDAALARTLLAAAPATLDDEATPSLVALIDEQLDDETLTPLDRALAAYRRVADDLAHVEVDRSVFGAGVRAPADAFRSGYADAREKLGILHAAFAAMGAAPRVYAVLRHDPGEAARLHPDNVKSFYLRIAIQGRYLYLDASGTSPHGEPRGTEVFVLDAEGARRADDIKPASTRMMLDVALDLRGDDPVATGRLVLRGAFNPYWSVFLEGGSCARGVIEDLLGDDADLEIVSASFTRLALDQTSIAFEARPLLDDGLLDTTLPSSLASRIEGWELWRTHRDVPIVVDDPVWERARIEVLLPEDARVLYAPDFEQTTGEDGLLSVFHSLGLDADHVALARRVDLSSGEVAPPRSGAFRDLLSSALARSQNRLVVEIPPAD
jgi:hypothetical protein